MLFVLQKTFIMNFFIAFTIVSLGVFSTCTPITSKKSPEFHQQTNCVHRLVYLKNSLSASIDASIILKTHQNKGTFIIETISLENSSVIRPRISRWKIVHPKFMPCYTILYLQDQFLNAGFHQMEKSKLIQNLAHYSVTIRPENPETIVYVTFMSQVAPKFYRSLKLVNTTAAFYLLSPKKLYLICSTCHPTLHGIHDHRLVSESKWREIHHKFGNVLRVTNFKPKGWDVVVKKQDAFHKCEFYPHEQKFISHIPFPSDCWLLVLKTRLNLSDSYETGSIPEGSLMTNNWMNVDNINTFVPVPYGINNDDLKVYFGTLTASYKQVFKSLIKPLDPVIWLLLVISIVCVCLFFRILFKWTDNSDNNNGGFISELHVMSTLLDQSQNILGNCSKFCRQVYWVFGCWLFLSFLIINSYKGLLFSYLTIPSIPNVPQTVQEILDSEYPVFTTSTTRRGSGPKVSVVKDLIRSQVDYMIAEKRTSRHSLLIHKGLEKRLDIVYHLGRFPAVVSSFFAAMMNGKTVRRGEIENYTVPKELIYVDSYQNFELFRVLNFVYNSEYYFSTGQQLDFLSSTTGWVVGKNVFYRLMLPYVQGAAEFGIFNRWRHYRFVMARYRYIGLVPMTMENSEDISKPNNIIWSLFSNSKIIRSVQAKPISMELLSKFILLLTYCLTICSLGFVIEHVLNSSFYKLLVSLRNWILSAFTFPGRSLEIRSDEDLSLP